MRDGIRKCLLLCRYPRLLLETLCLSAYYRFAILRRPFADLAPSIGAAGMETPENPPAERDKRICGEAAWAVNAVCKRTPWESKCLVRALTAKKLLNRRGLPCTLYMGVRLEPDGQMAAHAWLRCGTLYISGGDGSREYTVTAVYGDAGSRKTGTAV